MKHTQAKPQRQRKQQAGGLLKTPWVWLSALLVFGVLVAGLILMSASNGRAASIPSSSLVSSSVPSLQGVRLNPALSDRDHTQGPSTAPVTLVEYGDYQCPSCGRAYPIIKQLQAQFGDRLRFVFRNYPLTQYHPNAQHAAEAAEAAAAQGKFWPMHDYLFEHQNALDDEHLTQYAQAVGLDVPRFRDDMSRGAFTLHVSEDVASGGQSGVTGTPTLYVNGYRYDGSWDYVSLSGILQAAARDRTTG